MGDQIIKSDFGNHLRSIRKQKKVRQYELAAKLGVSQAVICQYEKGGRSPKIETIEKIRETLGCSYSDLGLSVPKIKSYQSISEIIDEVKESICNDYCKYPCLWNEEEQGMELCESVVCRNCPLNRL